ncbi:MAG: 50S ribosomal protein L31 [Candidatus Moranbacteria bacterium]|nr:50S ribosomal protein L31 [Candidatus Moranbacteria bacterium]
MKKKIHPEYQDCTITCACGNQVSTRATVKEMKIEVCSACHPFYTGKKKIVDSTGQVDRFMKRFSKTKDLRDDQKRRQKEKQNQKNKAKDQVKKVDESKKPVSKKKKQSKGKIKAEAKVVKKK